MKSPSKESNERLKNKVLEKLSLKKEDREKEAEFKKSL